MIVALAVGAAGYYFKIYKPKKEMDDAEDLDELTGGEDDEPMVNEDDLPPRKIPVREEAPEPDYRDAPEPYRGEYEDDEPEPPDYEDQ